MKRTSYHDALIRAELDSHVLDCIDDLVAEGYPATEAKKIAQKRFGNIDDITNQVRSIDCPLFHTWFSPLTLVTIAYCSIALLLYLASLYIIGDIMGDYVQLALFWWAQFGIICITVIIDYWILAYTGMHRLVGAWAILLFTVLQNVALTILLDIDHFETILHNLILLSLIAVGLWLFWHKLSLLFRQIALYSSSIIATGFVLKNHRIFEWLYHAKCLYITPDPVTIVGCAQVGWTDVLLWPIYLCTIVAVGYLSYGLAQYLRNPGTIRLRKIVVTVCMLSVLIVPIFINDLNNTAALDIIPWKHQINQAYREILGRNPEAKDIDFYSSSRAFEHMSRVRNALYASAERKIKINQLYQQVLHRNATTEEIDRHNQNQASIEKIYFELSGPLTP